MSSRTGPGAGWEPVLVTYAFMTDNAKKQLRKLFPDIKPDELVKLVVGQTAKRMKDDSQWFILNIEDARIVMGAIKGTNYTQGRFAITNVKEKWDR